MRNFEWRCDMRLTLLAQAMVSIATLDQLPDERDNGVQSKTERLLRKEAELERRSTCKPRGTNLANKSTDLCTRLRHCRPFPSFKEQYK